MTSNSVVSFARPTHDTLKSEEEDEATYRQTDRQTDGRTDSTSQTEGCLLTYHLKMQRHAKFLVA